MNIKVIAIILVIFGIGIFLFSKSHKPVQKVKVQSPTATINGKTFSIESAKDEKTRARGLSYRPSLAQEKGMLFIFEKSDKYSFWMKDMHFPIDIIYINNDTVVHVFENAPPPTSPEQKLPTYTPDAPADKVLEINAGLAKKYNIKKGDKVKVEILGSAPSR